MIVTNMINMVNYITFYVNIFVLTS